MKDEIKEKIPFNVRDVLEDINSNILWNYITNLQQENERLRKQIPSLDNCVPVENQMKISSVSHEINYQYIKTLYEKVAKDIVIDDLVYKCEDMQKLIETNEKLDIEKEDYKSRCEKAIEYIKNEMPYLEEPDEEIERIDGSIYMTMKEYDKNIILNILQNGSEEK
jgi:hypothetical protein